MTEPETFPEIADALYAVDPGDFVSARTEFVSRARAAGDREFAKRIAALRKPTVAAWLVNRLVRDDPDDVDALLGIGHDLRAAQRSLDASAMRSLSVARSRAVAGLERAAARLARESGRPVTSSTLAEVGRTLTAAVADPEVARRVREGRTVTGEDYEGFGIAPLTVVPPRDTAAGDTAGGDTETGAGDTGTGTDVPDPDVARRAEADRILAERETAARECDQAVVEREADYDEATARVADLRAALGAAEERARFALEGARGARSAAKDAARALAEARLARAMLDVDRT